MRVSRKRLVFSLFNAPESTLTSTLYIPSSALVKEEKNKEKKKTFDKIEGDLENSRTKVKLL